MNSWLKYRWPNKRALSVGAGRQHLDLLLSGLRGNLIAGNAYEQRTKYESPGVVEIGSTVR